ncbi:MAG TPA: hypothetical protein VGW30_02955 [Gaiellaceae bacterium]|nr:hypothetical protein [Gaiellaceae bacterium]
MSLKRLIVVILTVWLLLIVAGLIFFSVEGEKPGDGRGDTIEQPSSP